MGMDNRFLENKAEEALQLLSVQNELLEKQMEVITDVLTRMANMYSAHLLQEYLQNEKDVGGGSHI